MDKPHWFLIAALCCSCKSGGTSADMGPDGSVSGSTPLKITAVTTRYGVAEAMRAALEMQQSGEPLAQTMGRDLNGYDRNLLPPNLYTDPATVKLGTDVVGFSTAIESYEYSKFVMNALSFELGAGLSLMYGPLVNPGQAVGSAALAGLQTWVQKFAVGSHAGVSGAMGPFVTVPAPVDNPMNLLGFPGLMPQFAEFSSVQPSIVPSNNVSRGCSLTNGYGASGGMLQVVNDYECGYNTLHLTDRDSQVSVSGMKVLAADALGYAAWKQALWVTNYFQLVHDVKGGQYTALMNQADAALVGVDSNTVVAQADDGTAGNAGTFIGSSDLEGLQGQLMAAEIDNKAQWLLTSMTTADGQTLGSFQAGAVSAVQAALKYDYQSALRYIPHQVTVTEAAGQSGADPQPLALAMLSGASVLADLSALLGGYADFFALTDRGNPDVGGSLGAAVVFDGDPFPLDNGQPDGEATPHDRALAVIKVALVNLDRLHLDPASGALCDQVTMNMGAPVRSLHVDTVELAAAVVALRTAYRSLTSQLTLYSNSTPDTISTSSALDGTAPAGVPGGVTLAQRLSALIRLQADFLSTRLTDGNGLAVNGYDLKGGKADAGPTTLEAQAAAIKGLLAASLALSDNTYRDRAQQAYDALDGTFYSPGVRAYRSAVGNDQTFTFTPLRFSTLQAALREMYVLLGSRPGHQALGAQLQDRIGRLNKLVLNGWDDANGNNQIDYPGECMLVQALLPRGGLMMGERALTGELGSQGGVLTTDRDSDCVPNIDAGGLAATLAGQVVLERR